MTPRPRHTKKDLNHGEIRDGLRELGFVVWDLADLGGVVLDLLCFYRGICLPVEVKSPGGKLTEAQEESIAQLQAVGVTPIIAESIQDVLDQWPENPQLAGFAQKL